MNVYASFKSVNTPAGLKIFRYNTEFQSISGPGQPIGLVVMLNPGDARPESNKIFKKLETGEFDTNGPVLTSPDKTLKKVKKLIESLYQSNGKDMPQQFTIHIENLFNIRERNSDTAKRLANNLQGHDGLMFKPRPLKNNYEFVFFAWGKTDINSEKQTDLRKKYPNAISVHKLNRNGKTIEVAYPIHPLYMNSEYFIEASKGKLKTVATE
jgi:hypothetical protein